MPEGARCSRSSIPHEHSNFEKLVSADLAEADVEWYGYSSARWRKTSLVTIAVTAAEKRYPLSSRARRVESSV